MTTSSTQAQGKRQFLLVLHCTLLPQTLSYEEPTRTKPAASWNLLQLQLSCQLILSLLQFLSFFDVLFLKVVDFSFHSLQLRKQLEERPEQQNATSKANPTMRTITLIVIMLTGEGGRYTLQCKIKVQLSYWRERGLRLSTEDGMEKAVWWKKIHLRSIQQVELILHLIIGAEALK